MKNKTLKILAYVFSCLPILALCILFSKLPDQVPTHWNIDVTVTYSGKSNLWMISLMPLIMTVIFNITPKIDPRGTNYKRFSKYYHLFIFFLVLFLDIINAVILSETLYPGRISVSFVCILLVGCLFIFIGNILPKAKDNFTFGIKTPWTLSNPDVWNKTHRLGGKLFFFSGLVIIIVGILFNEMVSFIVVMASAVVTVLIPSVMSYIWYTKITKQN